MLDITIIRVQDMISRVGRKERSAAFMDRLNCTAQCRTLTSDVLIEEIGERHEHPANLAETANGWKPASRPNRRHSSNTRPISRAVL